MTQLDPATIRKRAARAWATKEQWRALYQEAYQYALPQRDLYTTYSQGQRKTDRVFDSTGTNSVVRFAGRMQSELTPPQQRWFELEAGPAAGQSAADLNRQLQPIGLVAAEVFKTGGFDIAVHEFYMDLAVGTAAMLVLDGDEEVLARFVAVPNAQIAIEEGPYGTIDGVYRRHKMAVRLIERTWPDAVIPAELSEKGKEPGDQEHEEELDEVTYYDPANRRQPWRYEVLWGEHRLVARQSRTSPWVITRWLKVPGETYGRGPLLAALPDLKTSNKVVEFILLNAALSCAGVFTVADDGVTNPDTVRIAPGALIRVQRNGGGPNGPSIAPLETGRGFDVAQLVLDDLRMQVKKALLDGQLPPDAGPVRSATEIVQRMKELAQDIGGAFGRLQQEMIVPLVRRVIDILQRRGFLPVDDGFRIDQMFIRVQVLSPLAKAQKLQDVQTIVQAFQVAQALGGPSVAILGMKVEDVIPYIYTQLGVPAQFIRSDQERGALQQAVAQLVAQQPDAAAAVNDNLGREAGGAVPARAA